MAMLVAAGISLAAFTSCIKDTPYGGLDGETLVTFSLRLPGQTAPAFKALSVADENNIQTIDILAFEPNGGTYIYSAGCNGSDITTDGGDARRKTFTVNLRQGDFDLVMVANARNLLAASALIGKNKAQALESLAASVSGKWPADGSRPIPMWGDVGDIKVDDNTSLTGSDAVKLIRMLARVDVSVTGTAAANFRLADVRVYNYNTQGSLVPLPGSWDTSDPNSPKASAPTVPASSTLIEGPLVYDGTAIDVSANKCEREIYIFESENHTSLSHNAGKGLLQRTCLVVGGIYDANGNGNFTDDGPATYYRVDFSNGQGTAQTFLDVLRNHLYVFNITSVSGNGYETPDIAFRSAPVNIEAGVLSWNAANMTEITFDGQYMLAVNRGSFEVPKEAKTVNKLTVKTDVPTGWAATVADGLTWLSISMATVTGGAGADRPLEFSVTENTDATRTGTIKITAGRLEYLVSVTQTNKPGLTISVDKARLDFPNYNIPTEQCKVTWEPADRPCEISVTPVQNNGLIFTNPLPSVTATGGEYVLDVKPSLFSGSEVAADPFLEKKSTLRFTITDEEGNSAYQDVELAQVNYAVVAETYPYYQMNGLEQAFTIKSNIAWVASEASADPSDIFLLTTTSGGESLSGSPVTFELAGGTIINGPLESSLHTVRFSDPGGLLAPVDVVINGISAYILKKAQTGLTYDLMIYPKDQPTGAEWYEYANVPGRDDAPLWTPPEGPQANPKRQKSCAALTLGGFDDWRLPTFNELDAVFKYLRGNNLFSSYKFPSSSQWYWSATQDGWNYYEFAIGVNTTSGGGGTHSYWTYHYKHYTNYKARAVRTLK